MNACPGFKDQRLVILHVNAEALKAEDKNQRALALITESLKIFVPAYKIYFGLFPIQVTSESAVKPVHTNPYLQSIVPVQSYGFFKSDPVDDVNTKEIIIMVESDQDNCRVDEIGDLDELISCKNPGAGLWMLAEQFMRQVAFYLGYIGKFGA